MKNKHKKQCLLKTFQILQFQCAIHLLSRLSKIHSQLISKDEPHRLTKMLGRLASQLCYGRGATNSGGKSIELAIPQILLLLHILRTSAKSSHLHLLVIPGLHMLVSMLSMFSFSILFGLLLTVLSPVLPLFSPGIVHMAARQDYPLSPS